MQYLFAAEMEGRGSLTRSNGKVKRYYVLFVWCGQCLIFQGICKPQQADLGIQGDI